LLAAGADIRAKKSDGNTALMLASKPGYDDIVQMLQSAAPKAKKQVTIKTPTFPQRTRQGWGNPGKCNNLKAAGR
jgi:ankyrin repeat protein